MQFKSIFRLSLLTALVAIAGCAKPVPPAPPPPPPPVVVAPPPPIPTPPLYAAANLVIPPMGVDGQRITPNAGIGELETLWHMRSALNVAALNCTTAEHTELTDNYNSFLTTHSRVLNDANKAIEAKFRREQGADYRRIRDTHSTQVYNFFSLPPVKAEFCDVALLVSRQVVVTPSDQINTYAMTGLRLMEDVFDRFFASYEQYQRNLIAWNAKYAPQQTLYTSGEPVNVYGDGSSDISQSYTPSAFANPAPGSVETTSLPASEPAADSYVPSAPLLQQLPVYDPAFEQETSPSNGPGFSGMLPQSSEPAAGNEPAETNAPPAAQPN